MSTDNIAELRVVQRFVVRLVVNSGAFYAATEITPSTHNGGWEDTLFLAIIFAIISICILPIKSAISTVISILTQGLYVIAINLGLLYAMQALATVLDMDYVIDKSYWALLGAFIISGIVFICTVIFRRTIIGI
jgi:uncharacterized membrane protein YvlD (DUF360 family)